MEIDLDLDLVHVFLVVAEKRSFSAAARATGRTQAAVSQQVKRLERQLGERLLHRTTREVSPTAAGLRFIPDARRLVELGVAAQRRVLGGAGPQRIRVGAPDEIMHRGLIGVLAGMRPALPAVDFELCCGPTRELLDGLGDGVEMVVGLALPESAGGRTLYTTPLAWIGDHVGAGPVRLAVYGEGCVMRTQAAAALDRAGIDWACAVEAGSAVAIEAAARHGLAVGVLPERLAAADLPRPAGLPPLPAVDIRVWAARTVAEEVLAAIAAAIGP